VQNFNENLSILVLLSTYALLMWLNLSIYIVILLFGTFVSFTMFFVRKHYQRNMRRGLLPPIPSEAHHP
jgi:LPLT family lysophospholipid transporter-like MFS transporter